MSVLVSASLWYSAFVLWLAQYYTTRFATSIALSIYDTKPETSRLYVLTFAFCSETFYAVSLEAAEYVLHISLHIFLRSLPQYGKSTAPPYAESNRRTFQILTRRWRFIFRRGNHLRAMLDRSGLMTNPSCPDPPPPVPDPCYRSVAFLDESVAFLDENVSLGVARVIL